MKVLVVVDGGIAEVFVEGNVNVEVFDWDAYSLDPDNAAGCPAEFAELALESYPNLPVAD